MYARRLKCGHQRWGSVFQSSKDLSRPNCVDRAPSKSLSRAPVARSHHSTHNSLIRRHLLDSATSWGLVGSSSYSGLHGRLSTCLKSSQLRVYSSEGDGRNTSEDEHIPVKDGSSIDKGKTRREKVKEDVRSFDAHARLGEQDQKEWLKNEKLAIENKKKESPFLTRREKFKTEFLRRILPWEKISVSWETFPYFIHDHTKNLLVECAASHLKHNKFTASYGARLTSSSGRILLQSVPGTELYRERLVRALARDLKVPLLVLDSNVLAPYDFGDDCASESELDDDESGEECTSESEVEDENDVTNEEDWNSSGEASADGSDNDEIDVQATAEAALKKLIPYSLEEFEKRVSGESESSSESSKSEAVESSDNSTRPLKKGDRVKYIGPSVHFEVDNRPLTNGQRGEVIEVNGDRVAVIWDISEQKDNDGEEEKLKEPSKPPIYWIEVKEIEHDVDTQAEDCYVAMEALCEVLRSMQPLIVYFPDSSEWLSRAVPKSNRKEFVLKVQEMFDQLSGPVVLICGQNKVESGSKEKEKFTMILPNFGRLAKLVILANL